MMSQNLQSSYKSHLKLPRGPAFWKFSSFLVNLLEGLIVDEMSFDEVVEVHGHLQDNHKRKKRSMVDLW